MQKGVSCCWERKKWKKYLGLLRGDEGIEEGRCWGGGGRNCVEEGGGAGGIARGEGVEGAV